MTMSTVQAGETPGLWLRRQRMSAGLTQEDLAERSGVSVRAIADLERGRTRRPYPSSVRALVKALGLPDDTGNDLVAQYRVSGGHGDDDGMMSAEADTTGEVLPARAGAGQAAAPGPPVLVVP